MERTRNGKRRRRRNRSHAWLVLLLASITVFLFALAALTSDYKTEAKEAGELVELAMRVEAQEQAASAAAVTTEEEGEQSGAQESPPPQGGPAVPDQPQTQVLSRFAELYAENPDLGGWIRIEGTKVDYPVMFTPNDPQKYLHRSFKGESSSRGVPFIGEGCEIRPRSDNITIYGHHMKSGDMFAAIVGYEDDAFWREHPYVEFCTLYEEAEYEVFAVIETDVYKARDLRCYTFVNADSEEDFDDYLSRIQAASLYDTGIDVAYGDELVTLSTCGYHTSNGRFLVIAKKVGSIRTGGETNGE
ncbi:MAG: class B sortase [Eubacteriales bacterium]|nr:class B sortase [Eubacteriales bacterium]